MILFLYVDGNVAPSKPMPLGHKDQSFPSALSFIVTDDTGNEVAAYSTIIKSDRFLDMEYNDLGALPKTAISILNSYAYRCDKIIGDDIYYARVTVMNQMEVDGIDWRKFDLIPYDSIVNMVGGHMQPDQDYDKTLFDAYRYCFGKEVNIERSPYIFNYLRAMKDIYFWVNQKGLLNASY